MLNLSPALLEILPPQNYLAKFFVQILIELIKRMRDVSSSNKTFMFSVSFLLKISNFQVYVRLIPEFI